MSGKSKFAGLVKSRLKEIEKEQTTPEDHTTDLAESEKLDLILLKLTNLESSLAEAQTVLLSIDHRLKALNERVTELERKQN